MIKRFFLVCGVMAVLGLVFTSAVSAAKPERAKRKPASQQRNPPHRHLSLMPQLCVEQFLNAGLAFPLAGPGAPGQELRPAAARVPQRLSFSSDWEVQPFVGATLATTAEAPERDPAPGGATLPGSAPLCQLDAGVSYNLSPGTSFNFGYRLPSSAWNSMFGALGDEINAPTDKKVSVGISVDF